MRVVGKYSWVIKKKHPQKWMRSCIYLDHFDKRGDVQPVLALAMAFRSQNPSVVCRFATHAELVQQLQSLCKDQVQFLRWSHATRNQ